MSDKQLKPGKTSSMVPDPDPTTRHTDISYSKVALKTFKSQIKDVSSSVDDASTSTVDLY